MNLFTADVGQGKVHVYDSGNDKFYGKLPQENLIDLSSIPGIKRGDVLAIECAHLRESHKLTLAQPFNYGQLEELKKNADMIGVTIKLFPQKSTPKARKLYGVSSDDKTDEIDTKAIASFLLKDEKAFRALKTFVPVKLEKFQNKNQYIFEYIQEANDDINEAKSSDYGLTEKYEYEDEVSRWIKKYTVDGGSSVFGYRPTIADYLNHDEELLNALGLSVDKKTGKLKIENGNRIYTLTTTILRPDGSLRLRKDNGLPAFWKYVKAHLLGCKPYHMNQGVIASNFKHWMRRTVSEYAYPGKSNANSTDFQVGMSYEEYFALKEARTKVDKMTRTIWQALRKMIVEDGLR
jgi:hypothetical protein